MHQDEWCLCPWLALNRRYFQLLRSHLLANRLLPNKAGDETSVDVFVGGLATTCRYVNWAPLLVKRVDAHWGTNAQRCRHLRRHTHFTLQSDWLRSRDGHWLGSISDWLFTFNLSWMCVLVVDLHSFTWQHLICSFGAADHKYSLCLYLPDWLRFIGRGVMGSLKRENTFACGRSGLNFWARHSVYHTEMRLNWRHIALTTIQFGRINSIYLARFILLCVLSRRRYIKTADVVIFQATR